MRLLVAALLLAAIGVATKIAVERVAPEGLASASGSLARAETVAPASDLVDEVRLVGPGLRASSLDRVIATRRGDKLSEADLAADGAAIVSALHATGHLDAAVGAPLVNPGVHGAEVDLPVDAGAVYTVRAVRWTGAAAHRFPAIGKLPVVAAGDPVAEARLASTAKLIEGWLAQRHVAAHASWTITVDRAAKLADVTFTVE